MKHTLLARVRSGWLGYAAALGAVALVSLFVGFVLGQVTLANASRLYLIAVLATAVAIGDTDIDVEARRVDGSVQLSVADRGPGIPLPICDRGGLSST